jgi:hypothetical protein
MDRDSINPEAVNLENAFFAKQDAELLRRMKEQAQKKERRAALREAAPNADDALLDHLIELGVGPETVLAVFLVPLAVVAWADGTVQERERSAILRAAEERGIKPGTAPHEMLESWLARRPGRELIDAWKGYVKAMWGQFDDAERRQMRERMVGTARAVAQSAGGFLGLTSGISREEQAVLDELEAALP